MIRINSENVGSYGSEQACAGFIASLCGELGLKTDLYSPMEPEGFEQHPDDVSGRHLKKWPNAIYCWKGCTD